MSQLKSINIEVIETLKSLGGIDLLIELNEVFIRSSQEIINDIQTAIKTNNSNLLQEKSHSLKSSSGNMGAFHLSEICLKLEKMGQMKNLSGASAVGAELAQEFKQVSSELAVLIGKENK